MTTGVLGALGGKFAERWAATLALPGLLYVAVAVLASVLGQRPWYPASEVRRRLAAIAAGSAGHGPGVVLLAVFGVLACAAGAAVAARGLGGLVERAWLVEGDPDATGPVGWLTRRRRARYRSAARAADSAHLAAARARRSAETERRQALVRRAERAYAVRNRISLREPCRPTWIGDRLAAAEARVHETYDLDLVSAWPRLWLVLPDGARSDLDRARAAFSAAAQLVAWAAGYAVLAVWWWPAAVIGCAVGVAGWLRGRAATEVLALLVESVVDVHGAELARALGFECPQRLTRAVGEQVTKALRKNT
ncbi:hypothetical protein GCM10010129_72750 [Streptomyces fumigatiscleroticus]|nr:hypothetical protein GCM10010129_72750 [Streptomyces fumigatiscleroticus]